MYAAAVILGDGHGIVGLADSKALSAPKREALAAQIKESALAWSSPTRAWPKSIDTTSCRMHAGHAPRDRGAGRGARRGLDRWQSVSFVLNARRMRHCQGRCNGGRNIGGSILTVAKVARDAELVQLDAGLSGIWVCRAQRLPHGSTPRCARQAWSLCCTSAQFCARQIVAANSATQSIRGRLCTNPCDPICHFIESTTNIQASRAVLRLPYTEIEGTNRCLL